MEIKNFLVVHNRCSERTSGVRFIKKSGKLTRAVYAGLIVCFVPSVLCQDWSRQLTFDDIYNDTNYVHLQQRVRPYGISEFSYSHTYNLDDGRNLDNSHSYNLEEEKFVDNRFNLAGNPDSSHRPNLNEGRYLANSHSYSLEDGSDVGDGNGYNLEEDYRGNEVDLDEDTAVSSLVKEPLLVGFSHDPFRYSVPEKDYLKGVRNMNPSSIMGKGENRGKRGVLHLYNMMYCATGCEPLAYKGYGCYCGFLGSGMPTDGIDRCCKMHDECYENIYCPFYTVYFQPYYWKCYRGQPLCALENYHTQHQFINGCAARLCECDRRFAMCVKRYPCPRKRALCHSSPIRLLQNLLMFR